MLHIEVITDKVEARLNAMTTSIKTFGATEMPQELTNWQIEDMRRSYPETKIEQGGADSASTSASTMIYPRSRTYEQTHPQRDRAGVRSKRQLSSMPVLRQSQMRHPILRPLLFDKLFTRMVALLTEKITWRSISR